MIDLNASSGFNIFKLYDILPPWNLRFPLDSAQYCDLNSAGHMEMNKLMDCVMTTETVRQAGI